MSEVSWQTRPTAVVASDFINDLTEELTRLYSPSTSSPAVLCAKVVCPAASHSKPLHRNSNIMHQAQVQGWGQAPKYIEANESAPGPDETRITVLATGVHQVVRSRAAGKHYSSGTQRGPRRSCPILSSRVRIGLP